MSESQDLLMNGFGAFDCLIKEACYVFVCDNFGTQRRKCVLEDMFDSHIDMQILCCGAKPQQTLDVL